MKCPNCKDGDLKEQVQLKGITIFTRKKVITWFCPCCDFTNERILSISNDDYVAELKRKSREYKTIYQSGKL
jgi:hypothetical protein